MMMGCDMIPITVTAYVGIYSADIYIHLEIYNVYHEQSYEPKTLHIDHVY